MLPSDFLLSTLLFCSFVGFSLGWVLPLGPWVLNIGKQNRPNVTEPSGDGIAVTDGHKVTFGQKEWRISPAMASSSPPDAGSDKTETALATAGTTMASNSTEGIPTARIASDAESSSTSPSMHSSNQNQSSKEMEIGMGTGKGQKVDGLDHGGIDPWKDDVEALGLVRQNISSAENPLNTTEGDDDDAGGRVVVSIQIRYENKRQELCSKEVGQHVPTMLTKSLPFGVFELGAEPVQCLDSGTMAHCSKSVFAKESAHDGTVKMSKGEEFWWQVLNDARSCRLQILSERKKMIASQPSCHVIFGFVDHFYPAEANSNLVAKMRGPLLAGHSAVVRLLCANDSVQFMAAAKRYIDKFLVESSEEKFLKTVFALKFASHPDCTVVFFDMRTLKSKYEMGKLLLGKNRLYIGTKGGNHTWAATKFVCGRQNQTLFLSELDRMRMRNRNVPKELDERDEKIREVLAAKIDEEMFPIFEVTTTPANGFLGRVLSNLFG